VTQDGYFVANSAQGAGEGPSPVAITVGEASSPMGCFGDVSSPGQTAVASAEDGTLWPRVGGNLARSTDWGKAWR
jgi:hypothetical protein